MTMRTKLTKTGMNALTSPFQWIIVTGIVYFVASGRIDAWRAWLYIGVYLVGSFISGFLLLKKVPGLLNQRGKIQEGTKKWDMLVILMYFLLAIVVTPLIAGLDERFAISPLSFPLAYVGLGLYVLSVFLSIWPMPHNPFFEGTVRIQKESGHKVIQTGPYRLVRHPGYLGMLFGSLPIPFAFGSALSLVPAGVMVLLVLIRTYCEDRTLMTELEGYREYSRKVRYRLIPWIW